MKKTLLFAATMFAAVTMSAQTITIDGANSDWAGIPMLSEPGGESATVLKIVVPQDGMTLPDGAAYCLMVTGDHEQILAGYPVIYTDADNDNTTGTKPWFLSTMGYDYEMATWSTSSSYAASETGNIREMCIMKAAFSSVPFSGSFGAWLTFNWGALYVPNSPEPSGDNWKWDQSAYHHLTVAPYTFADLNGKFEAAKAYSTHQVLAPGASFNMKVAGSANDTLLWASWTVELKTAGKYTVSADVTSSNSASVDLDLVDMATNAIVASFRSEDKWAPAGSAEYGEWDLSSVPAGKYMLKFSNHVAWSEMVLSSITLTGQGVISGIESTSSSAKAVKVIRNGQVLFIRDGRTFNALGSEVR